MADVMTVFYARVIAPLYNVINVFGFQVTLDVVYYARCALCFGQI